MNEMSHPPVVIVDGSAWDLSNLTSDKYDNNDQPQGGPECDTSTRSRRSDLSEDSLLAFASYPPIDDLPEVLDVDDIFQKLKANNLVKMGKVANSHLPSRSSASERSRKKEAAYRPRSSASSTSRRVPDSPLSTPSRESVSGRRERRERRARHHDRSRFDRTDPTLQGSRHMPSRQQSQSDILRQAMDNADRPGDEIAASEHADFDDESSSSTYEAGRQKAYQRQPLYKGNEYVLEEEEEEDGEEEERMLVEVTPGNYVPLRGSAEIWDAVLSDNTVECFCFGCTLQLVTVSNADMVMCVACHTISPVDGGLDGGGLGLGMKGEDATYERRRFEEASRKRGNFI